tara:strand:- start:10118 stop:10843 length:726 start_codon:yes stop_codon:yes gene_type:complete
LETYEVKGKEHKVYNVSEVPEYIQYLDDWRDARKGDWVKTDDSKVIQVLRRYKAGRDELMFTAAGTVKIAKKSTLRGIRKGNIYSLNGKNWYDTLKDRKNPTKLEIMFAKRLKYGEEPYKAYLEVYNTDNVTEAKKKAAILIKTKRIQKLMDEDLKDVFAAKGVDLDYLIGACKEVVDGGKNDSDRLKALNMLWDAFGVVKQKQVTEVRGVFQGFSPEEIEGVQRQEIKGNNNDTTKLLDK